MRIGILTQPLRANYGGVLQNYALQKVLRNLGHEPITLDGAVRCYDDPVQSLLSKLKISAKELLHKSVPTVYTEAMRDKAGLKIRPFIDRHISRTAVLKSSGDYRKALKKLEIDTLVVGSDQVWRPVLNRGPMLMHNFCDFAGNDIRKIAYAASFGVNRWEFDSRQTRRCIPLISRFSGVSVREQSGVGLCKRYLGADAVQVLDPTLLLEKEDYQELMDNYDGSGPCVFAYLLDKNDEKWNFIQRLADEDVLPIETIETDIVTDLDRIIPQPSVESWLSGFEKARYTIVDSFHGMVFSIIFNKPFVVLANEERGLDRFTSLLSLLHLEDRILFPPYDSGIIRQDINWNPVNAARARLKSESISFLTEHLQ